MTILAGLPTTMALSGISLMTTVPTPIVTLLPILQVRQWKRETYVDVVANGGTGRMCADETVLRYVIVRAYSSFHIDNHTNFMFDVES